MLIVIDDLASRCQPREIPTGYNRVMLLAVDAGNTSVKFAVYDGDHLRVHWRIRTQTGRTADEYSALLHTLFALDALEFSDIDAFVLASVVPGTTPDLERLALATFGCEPLRVSAHLDLGFTVAYQPPTDVGTDRLADVAAALHKYGPAPLIVIDFGTGTTFNAVAPGPVYLGGAICPGVALSWDALYAQAARLSRVEMDRPASSIGGSTREALQSGMLYGVIALIDGMATRFQEEMDAPDCPVIATGGNGTELLLTESQTLTHIDPLLTLDGLRLIHERNRRE